MLRCAAMRHCRSPCENGDIYHHVPAAFTSPLRRPCRRPRPSPDPSPRDLSATILMLPLIAAIFDMSVCPLIICAILISLMLPRPPRFAQREDVGASDIQQVLTFFTPRFDYFSFSPFFHAIYEGFYSATLRTVRLTISARHVRAIASSGGVRSPPPPRRAPSRRHA